MKTWTKSLAVAALAAATGLAHGAGISYPGENSMSRFTGEWNGMSPSPAVVAHDRVSLAAAPYGDNSLNRTHGESAAAFTAAAATHRDDPKHDRAIDRDARQRVPLENLAHTRRSTDPFAGKGA